MVSKGWLYICEKCGEGCREKSSRIIEDGPEKGKRWCVDCIAESDPLATY